MISKEDLLKELKQALITEEKSIPIYMKHLDLAVFWTGWDEKIAAKVKAVFAHLAQESTRHKGMIANLIVHIEKEERNAF